MSLFLPILLLGLTQPADQPVTPPAAQPPAQAQNSVSATSPSQKDEASQSPQPRQQFKHFDLKLFDPIEVYPSATGDLCLTMRSYYFQRRDGNAPEFQGMTTCETGRDMAKRNAKQDHDPRLVPLAAPGK